MLAKKDKVNVSLFQDLTGGINDFDIVDQLHQRARDTLMKYLQSQNVPAFVIELYTDLLGMTVDMMSRMSAEDVSIFDWDLQMVIPSVVLNVAKVEELLCQSK